MGESLPLFRPEFNRSIQIEARSEKLTSDAGALLLREYDEKVGLTRGLRQRLGDPRDPSRVVHSLDELLRCQLYLAAQGWSDQDDATSLRDDPAFRAAVSSRRGTAPLAPGRPARVGAPAGLPSQPTLSRLLALLSTDDHRALLREALLDMAVHRLRAAGQLDKEHWLDIDSVAFRVHGHQDGAEYNGHFHSTCYHPLIACLGEEGDLVGVWLRHGRAHTAENAPDSIIEVVSALRRRGVKLAGVRLDAGFPSETLMAALEAAGVHYVARLRSNSALDRCAGGELHFLPRLNMPDGSAVPAERLTEVEYKAGSWSADRRVVCVVVQEPDELVARHFYLLTDRPTEDLDAATLLATYRRRGLAESCFGEWKTTVSPMLSSTNRQKSTYRGVEPSERTPARDAFACNDALLLLSALAYGLMHGLRVMAERATQRGWSLQRLREQLLKVAARLRRGGRRLTFVLPRAAARLQGLVWRQLDALGPLPA